MPATLTSINAIMKDVYAPMVESQLQQEVVGLKRIESTSDGLVDGPGGKYVSFPIKVGRNSGVGSRLENENTPAAGQQGYAYVSIPLKYDYGTVRLTGQVIKLAATNKQAFAVAADNEMSGLKDDLIKNTSRVVYGDGTGLMASVVSDGANNVVVDNIQYLSVGDQVDILTRSNGATKALDRTITNIVPTTGTAGTVTYSGADVTATNLDGIYRQGNYVGGLVREAFGFAKIIGSGALHGVDSATQPKWQSIIVGNAGTNRALSEGLMLQMCDNIRQASGKRPTVIFTSLGVRRSYFNLLTQQRRFTDTKEYAGGMVGLPFNYGTEIPVVDDVDAPYNKMLMVHEPVIKMLKNTDWEWADEGGSTLTKVSGVDAFEGLMRKFWELATSARNAHGRIDDIIEG